MNKNLTEVVFLLDRSGSMGGLEKDTIGGYNSFLDKQKKQEGRLFVTTVLFDDKYELLWNGVDAENIRLTDKEYFVRGSTALLDAVGKTIIDVDRRLSNTQGTLRPGKLIFVIITDGMENSSREFSYHKVRELIQLQKEKYNWDFIFLGANIDTAQEAGNIGIDESNAYSFEATGDGVETMYCMVSEAVTSRRHQKQK